MYIYNIMIYKYIYIYNIYINIHNIIQYVRTAHLFVCLCSVYCILHCILLHIYTYAHTQVYTFTYLLTHVYAYIHTHIKQSNTHSLTIPLYQDYTSFCWYWEVIESMKRALVIGIFPLIFSGSILQVFICMCLLYIY